MSASNPKNRRQFKLWLIERLIAHAVPLSPNASYKEIREALERFYPFTP